MRFFLAALEFIADPANWAGPTGIGARLLEHLLYSGLALVLAALIAIPLGLYVGHTGRGRELAVGVSGALRAMPSLGLLTFLAVSMGFGLRLSIIPSTIVLAILAIPPLLANTYAGVEAIDETVVDGARSTGFSEGQIVGQVELPLAAPMIVGGLRSATLQVIATATVSAYLGLGGFGRYILDGLPIRNYALMLAGSLLVMALALVADGLLALLQRAVTTRGVRAATGQSLGPDRGRPREQRATSASTTGAQP
ncbi:ABC transporter permease [Nigerium massiliense]|uniref:ABC transporter permease n=1 Tax=Nigerium massiliense TaxID=1522317 RepID=UPI00058F751D|nr:ABC transporter permease [Nigerium massiliense]